jgi:hypothetical protein
MRTSFIDVERIRSSVALAAAKTRFGSEFPGASGPIAEARSCARMAPCRKAEALPVLAPRVWLPSASAFRHEKRPADTLAKADGFLYRRVTRMAGSFGKRTLTKADMTNTMMHKYQNDVFVLVHGKRSPCDAEWDLYLTDLRAQAGRLDCVRTLVITEGGNPDGAQRQRLNQLLRGRPTRAAVLTASIVARGVVGALAVFNPSIRAFSPDAAGLALAYLGVPTDEYGPLLRTIAELRLIVARQANDGMPGEDSTHATNTPP